MALITKSIGATGDYSTIADWEAARAVGDAWRGELQAQNFAENVTINGVTHTAANYGMLTCEDDAYHDGRANTVSGVGNARITSADEALTVVVVNDEYFHVVGIEIISITTSTTNRYGITYGSINACTCRITHNLVHRDIGAGVDSHMAINIDDSSANYYVYRNICYGFGAVGIHCKGATAGSVAFFNTMFANGLGQTTENNLFVRDSDWTCKYNAAFGSDKDIWVFLASPTMDYNFSSMAYDVTCHGPNGEGGLTTADQFTDPDTTWADTDLTLLETSDLIEEGTAESEVTYPLINVPANSLRTMATIPGAWDAGACQLTGMAVGSLRNLSLTGVGI